METTSSISCDRHFSIHGVFHQRLADPQLQAIVFNHHPSCALSYDADFRDVFENPRAWGAISVASCEKSLEASGRMSLLGVPRA